MKPRIIFFDIDGTLVPLKEGIRPRTVEALQKTAAERHQALHCHRPYPHGDAEVRGGDV